MNMLNMVSVATGGLMLVVAWLLTGVCWWGVFFGRRKPWIRALFALPVTALTGASLVYSAAYVDTLLNIVHWGG